jgi:hypothetical protein
VTAEDWERDCFVLVGRIAGMLADLVRTLERAKLERDSLDLLHQDFLPSKDQIDKDEYIVDRPLSPHAPQGAQHAAPDERPMRGPNESAETRGRRMAEPPAAECYEVARRAHGPRDGDSRPTAQDPDHVRNGLDESDQGDAHNRR